jgi:hypothetical protein
MIEWELLLIDNASQNPLQNLVDLSWHPIARIIHEPAPGLTPARLRYHRSGRRDHNLRRRWQCSRSFLFKRIHADRLQFPCLGAWRGQLLSEFEIPPAPGLEDLLGACLEEASASTLVKLR